MGRAPKGKACLPTINFHVRFASFREGNHLLNSWDIQGYRSTPSVSVRDSHTAIDKGFSDTIDISFFIPITTGWWQLKCVANGIIPKHWGRFSPILTSAYFSDGLEPTTNYDTYSLPWLSLAPGTAAPTARLLNRPKATESASCLALWRKIPCLGGCEKWREQHRLFSPKKKALFMEMEYVLCTFFFCI